MPAPNWAASTLPVSGDWRGVAYGGGRFIAWQNSGTTGAYSDDRGATWTALTLPASGITSLAYFGSTWYMISVYNGSSATLQKSTDGGVTWTVMDKPDIGTTNSDYYWRAFVPCNGRLYLFANGGTNNAYYTTDGTTWNLIKLPLWGEWDSMAYGNGVYVLTRSGYQEQCYSYDGVTWQICYLPEATNNWKTVAFGNGAFVVCNYGQNIMARSTDGVNWTTVSVSTLKWENVVFGSGTFIATSSNSKGTVYWSDDGLTWIAISTGTSAYYIGVAYADGAFIIVPYAYYGSSNNAAARALYNRTPGTPGWISYADPRAGETIALTCGAVTDPDGDTVTYQWQVSVDGGAWVDIGGTTVTAHSYTVPTSGTTIAFRVYAWDMSNWNGETCTGSTLSIYYNQPPSVPASIHYDTPKAGKKLAIICAESTDPENETIHYVWERSIDSGIYSQIGITYVNVFEDTVPTSGTTYRLRVKAADSNNNESAYCYGTLQTINYNLPPTITGADESRGELTGPFTYAYTPADPDEGNTITVVEAVDGVEIKRFTATSGKEYTADISGVWLTLGNGSHRLTITASDQDGESVTRVIQFTRTVDRIEVRRAMETPALVRKCFISIFPKIEPEDEITEVVAEVTNNPYDETPVWEDISEKLNAIVHIFDNETLAGTPGIGYRIRIKNAESNVYLYSVACRYNTGQAATIDESTL